MMKKSMFNSFDYILSEFWSANISRVNSKRFCTHNCMRQDCFSTRQLVKHFSVFVFTQNIEKSREDRKSFQQKKSLCFVRGQSRPLIPIETWTHTWSYENYWPIIYNSKVYQKYVAQKKSRWNDHFVIAMSLLSRYKLFSRLVCVCFYFTYVFHSDQSLNENVLVLFWQVLIFH